MATLEENINQAIADFDDIEAAITEQGVEVPEGTDTSQYGNLIRSIVGGGGNCPIKYLVSDSDNPIFLRDLESGTYVLKGAFRPYVGSSAVCRFSSDLLVNVVKGTLKGVPTSHIQIFYPVNNVVQFCEITDDSYNRTDIKLNELASAETIEDMLAIASNALKATASGEVVRVDDVSPIEHKANVKVSGKNLITPFTADYSSTHGGVTQTCKANGQTITLNGIDETGGGRNAFKGFGGTLLLKAGKTYTLSHSLVSGEVVGAYSVHITRSSDNYSIHYVRSEQQSKTFCMEEDTACHIGVNSEMNSVYTDAVICFQVEEGDAATEYEPYIDPTTVTVTRYGADEADNPQTYTPSADGICEIDSLSPTMTVVTDKTGVNIELEYSQDTTKAMDNVKTDIRTLDADMAVLKESVGDFETALAELHTYAQGLISGGDA